MNTTTTDVLDEIRKMAADGYGDHVIAQRLGRPRQWVCHTRSRHGIPAGIPRGMPLRPGTRREMPKTFDLEDTEEL